MYTRTVDCLVALHASGGLRALLHCDGFGLFFVQFGKMIDDQPHSPEHINLCPYTMRRAQD